MRRGVPALLLCLGLVFVFAATGWSCHSGEGLAGSCAINSDRDKPLICAFGHCHNACTATSDCPAGSLCVVSGTNGVCELPSENACNGTSPCPTPLLCASDSRCRSSCVMSNQCAGAQTCVVPPTAALGACFDSAGLDGGPGDGATTDGAHPGDSGGSSDSASPTDGGPDGTTGPDGSGGRDSTTGGPDGNGFDSSVNGCPSAQTQFGGIAHGDANSHFTSGVGVRTPSQVLIFSTYVGPAISGIDAGMQSDAGTVSIMYMQAFDPVTGASAGPAAPVFPIPNLPGVRLEDASISPNGKIVLLFGYGPFFGYGTSGIVDSPLYAVFLSPLASDGGPPSLAVEQLVELESQYFYGQPHATWSVSASAFSLSWEAFSNATQFYINVSNFTPSGTGAGGGTNMVPTTVPSAQVSSADFDQGSVGAGDGLTGVVFVGLNNNNPWLTILDALGNAVGGAISLGPNNSTWMTVGGTSRGFVALTISSAQVVETFVGTSADGGIATIGDAGLPTHTFPGAGAVGGRAISDDTGGFGGVGGALLYPNGVSFVYVSADGTTRQGPLSVLAAAHVYGDLAAITNYGGSFSLSLYSPTDGSTQAAASGCP